MSVEQLRNTLPSFAQDIKINLGNVLNSEDSPLDQLVRYRIGLASAYATRNVSIAQAIEQSGRELGLIDADVHAAKLAATLMAMNNVYYRFLHLAHEPELQKLPARLRMQGLVTPGISKLDFELMSLAVSAINGCGMCIEAHNREVLKHDVGVSGLQEVARIAAVVHGAAQGLALVA
ncbi:MAG: carboxymuconolactone decarboxylase family protein [Pseudohongiellaceae bacterium]|jgi:lipoyl-dependent peroxiredoxin subunit D